MPDHPLGARPIYSAGASAGLASISACVAGRDNTHPIKLVLDGKNLADGTPVIVTVDEATITPDGAVDFLSSEFVELGLTGSMRLQTGKTAPYTVELLDA